MVYAGYREFIGNKWTDIALTVILTFEFTYVTKKIKENFELKSLEIFFLFLTEIKLQLPFSLISIHLMIY